MKFGGGGGGSGRRRLMKLSRHASS